MNNEKTNYEYKRTILVIEDNLLNREILVSILQDSFSILEASNGLEGLSILKDNADKISLILLDIQMPVMNGFEFLEEIKKTGQFSNIPIIVTTSEKSEEEKCLSLGASDFVGKPYSANILISRVNALIRLTESIKTIQATKFDDETGLYNRSLYLYYVTSHIKTYGGKYSLFLISLENYSQISSSVGESALLNLFKFIGNNLLTIEVSKESFARYDVNHFICFVEYGTDFDDLVNKIDSLLMFKNPVPSCKFKYAFYPNIDANISLSTYVARLLDSLSIIRHDFNTSKIVFDDQMLKREETNNLLESCMQESLANKDFKVFYQPKHNCQTGVLAGCEALVRWIHPSLGFVSPGDFIPLFEENGFITNLDLYILDTVCMDLQNYVNNGIKPVPVSINLSRRDLASLELEDIDKVVNKYNIDKKLLHFEITESTCGEGDVILNKARLLKENGYQIEIDDFGSGYSSLGMISEIPMNYLKLDIAFARNLNKQKEVVKTIILLAHSLDAQVIAEGVESDEQMAIYKEFGCDYIQGYYFSKPLKKEEYDLYIRKW